MISLGVVGMELSNKQRVFVEEYLKCWNAADMERRTRFWAASCLATFRRATPGGLQ